MTNKQGLDVVDSLVKEWNNFRVNSSFYTIEAIAEDEEIFESALRKKINRRNGSID